MIHIEVLQSSDSNVLAPFNFFQNQIYIGRETGDLCINDKNLNTSHIMLEVVENELLIHPQRGTDFFLINGKRSTIIKKLRAEDIIKIGETTIKILSFSETIKESKKKILNEKLKELMEKNSYRLVAIESLTKLMK
jgi:hypothetical protein